MLKLKNINELLSQADVACYTAKDLGRNRSHIYHPDDAELSKRHSDILRVAGIKAALKQNRFHLYAQPIQPIDDSKRLLEPQRYELLLRMYDEDGYILLPGSFIPAAERYGLMGNIDRWVIQKALCNFEQLFNTSDDVMICINLSGNSLNDDGLLNFVKRQMHRSNIRPGQLCFEITETAVISNIAQASRFINEMKNLGCYFALDDFGSGLSSFTYLKHFPVDYLKIDGSFVRDIVNDATDHAMVSAINQVGHTLGIKTIAEFAESESIIDVLRELEVDYIQGYAVGRPKPLPI